MDCYKHFFTIFWNFKWRIGYGKYSSLWKINRQWRKWQALAKSLPLSTIFQLSRLSILLVEETGVPWENHQPVASHWQTLSHNAVSSTPRLNRVRTHNIVVIGTECTGSKFNYHTITTTTAPSSILKANIYILEKIVTISPN